MMMMKTVAPARRISGSSPRGRPGTPSGTFYTDDDDEDEEDDDDEDGDDEDDDDDEKL